MTRFWDKIEKTDSCWIWTAARDKGGYGKFHYKGKIVSSHRLSYLIFRGEILEGKQIDHLCRNPSCVNPEHLETVTQRENIMRSFAPSAFYAQRTHCINGHSLSGNNIRIRNNSRICLKCQKLWKNNHKQFCKEYARKYWQNYKKKILEKRRNNQLTCQNISS